MMVICIFTNYGTLQRICTSPRNAVSYMEGLVDSSIRESNTILEVHDTFIEVGNGENATLYTFQGICLDDDIKIDLNKSIIALLVRRFQSHQWAFYDYRS